MSKIKNHLLPTINSKTTVAESRLHKIEAVNLTFANQQQVCFERVVATDNRSDASILVIPIIAQKFVLLIREYAVGIEDYVWSLPKGYLEPDEQVSEAVNRELAEETGFQADNIQLLGDWYLSPMYMSFHSHFACAHINSWQPLTGDEPELMRRQLWPLDKIGQLLLQPWFIETRAAFALLLWQNFATKN